MPQCPWQTLPALPHPACYTKWRHPHLTLSVPQRAGGAWRPFHPSRVLAAPITFVIKTLLTAQLLVGFDFTARAGGKSWPPCTMLRGYICGVLRMTEQGCGPVGCSSEQGSWEPWEGRPKVTVEGPLRLGDRASGSALAGSLNNRVSSPASYVVPEHRARSDFLSLTE